jgi:hypothetical protein
MYSKLLIKVFPIASAPVLSAPVARFLRFLHLLDLRQPRPLGLGGAQLLAGGIGLQAVMRVFG